MINTKIITLLNVFYLTIRVVVNYTNVAVYSFEVWFRFIVQHIQYNWRVASRVLVCFMHDAL